MKINSIIKGMGAAAIAAAALAGCAATDVVAKVATASFAAVVAASGDRVARIDGDRAWEISSPNGDRFLLSSDLARAGEAAAGVPDAEFAFDASPFVAAGLDPSKLPATDGVAYGIEGGKLIMGFELGSDRYSPDAGKSIEATFAELVKFQRARVGYHEKLDHYGIKLGDGNMFEWAKDMATNDKDMVFALNPEPFIAASVDPSRISGWTFAKVETKDDAGRAVQVDKLLKWFNLK